jgi:hypothetical protein
VLPWPPLLALICGARSQDPVQVGYRCLRTLISLGLLGLRVAILFLGCSRYANDEDPRGRSLVSIPVRSYWNIDNYKSQRGCSQYSNPPRIVSLSRTCKNMARLLKEV